MFTRNKFFLGDQPPNHPSGHMLCVRLWWHHLQTIACYGPALYLAASSFKYNYVTGVT